MKKVEVTFHRSLQATFVVEVDDGLFERLHGQKLVDGLPTDSFDAKVEAQDELEQLAHLEWDRLRIVGEDPEDERYPTELFDVQVPLPNKGPR